MNMTSQKQTFWFCLWSKQLHFIDQFYMPYAHYWLTDDAFSTCTLLLASWHIWMNICTNFMWTPVFIIVSHNQLITEIYNSNHWGHVSLFLPAKLTIIYHLYGHARPQMNHTLLLSFSVQSITHNIFYCQWHHFINTSLIIW